MTVNKANYLELLGRDQQALSLMRKNIDHDMKKYYRGPGSYGAADDQLRPRMWDAEAIFLSLVGRHYGVDYHTPDEIAQLLASGIDIVVDYFFGKHLLIPRWAEQMSKSPQNKQLQWLEPYQYGTLFCLLAHDDERLKRLAEWVEPGLPLDETPNLLSVQDNSYHKLLAEFLSEGTIANEQLREDIVESRKRRPKLLLSCLGAIEASDEQVFVKHFKSYLNHFLKTDFADGGFQRYVSIEGSILWHVASRNGITGSGLSDKQHAVIITRESLGIE